SGAPSRARWARASVLPRHELPADRRELRRRHVARAAQQLDAVAAGLEVAEEDASGRQVVAARVAVAVERDDAQVVLPVLHLDQSTAQRVAQRRADAKLHERAARELEEQRLAGGLTRR